MMKCTVKILDSINCGIEDNNIKIRNSIDIIESLCKKELLRVDQIEFWKEKVFRMVKT